MKEIFLYGLSGPEDQYRVVRYSRIRENSISINEIIDTADMMRIRYPSIKQVWAIDSTLELYYDYRDAFKRNSVEGWIIFKDILERDGLRIR